MSNQRISADSSPKLVTCAEVGQAMHFAAHRKLRGCHAKVQSGEWIKIARGVYLEAVVFRDKQIWHQRQIAAIARALAVGMTGHRVILGLSAALISDLPLLYMPQNVTANLYLAQGTVPVLPAVFLEQKQILPAGSITNRRLLLQDLTWERQIRHADTTGSLFLETLPGCLLTIARTAAPEQAFIALCMGLHQASAHEHVRFGEDRNKVEWARSVLLTHLDHLPPKTHGVRRARLLIQEADGGCDSVGEARVLWVLKCAGVQGVRTQHIVGTEEGSFFIDLAIPSVKLAIEFDGFSKYDTSPLVHEQWSQQNRREQAIARHGYLVHRFQWDNFNNPARMLTDLSVKLAHRGQGLPIQPTPFTKMFGIHAVTKANSSQRSHSSWS